MRQISYNPSILAHLIIGIITSIWLVIFLILIAPFDTSDLTLINRILLLPLYGFIFLMTYMMVWPVQNYLFKRYGYWNLGMETIVILLSFAINLILTFSYYRTSIINGDFEFKEFAIEIYLPILVIISMPLFIARWYFGQKYKSSTSVKSSKQILRGDNKDDVLQLSLDHIICISSAQNYIEVNYLHDGIVKKKLLRSTLKNIYSQVPNFIQSHRSHIFNPIHFVGWNSNSMILVNTIEIPVSKKYRNDIESHFNLIPKT